MKEAEVEHYDTTYWAKRAKHDMRPWNRLSFAIRRRLRRASLIRQRDEIRAEYVQARNPILMDEIRELDRDITNARLRLKRDPA